MAYVKGKNYVIMQDDETLITYCSYEGLCADGAYLFKIKTPMKEVKCTYSINNLPTKKGSNEIICLSEEDVLSNSNPVTIIRVSK